MSFLGAVESRLKMKFGKDINLSAQQILSCNYLNEGCEGGWSMFNGFLMESGHFVSEECGPYRGSTNGDSCKFYQKCEPIAKIADSYFIETSQKENSVNEKKIMKEIFRNGAVVGEFKAPNRFRYYDKGILIDEDKPANM